MKNVSLINIGALVTVVMLMFGATPAQACIINCGNGGGGEPQQQDQHQQQQQQQQQQQHQQQSNVNQIGNGWGNFSPSATASSKVYNSNSLGLKLNNGQNIAPSQVVQTYAPADRPAASAPGLSNAVPTGSCWVIASGSGGNGFFSLGVPIPIYDNVCGDGYKMNYLAKLAALKADDPQVLFACDKMDYVSKYLPACKPAKAAEAPASTASMPAPQVVAAADPSCVTDEFIARRLGKAVCH